MAIALTLLGFVGLLAGARLYWLLRQAKRLGHEELAREMAVKTTEAKNVEAEIYAAPARSDSELDAIMRRRFGK